MTDTTDPDGQPLLSVVMPVFNERPTVLETIATVCAAPVDSMELIVVDDCSTDGTREALAEAVARHPQVKVFFHEHNRGKGAALRTGFANVTRRFVLIQDADNEYDPNEYPGLARAACSRATPTWSSAAASWAGHTASSTTGTRSPTSLLTLLSNMVTDLNLTDMETCYKVFRREVLQQLDLREDRFGIEPEITAKVAQLGVRVYEVPISYNGRTYAEGKKIGFKDAFRAVYCILRYGVPARLDRRSPARLTGLPPEPDRVDLRARWCGTAGPS